MSARHHIKKTMVVLGVGVAAYVVYTVYRAIASGITDIGSLIAAPFTFISNEFSAVQSSVSNISAGNAAATTITAQNNNAYAPGGSIYNQIASTQGQAAADAAWQTVQMHQATQTDQTTSPLLGALGL